MPFKKTPKAQKQWVSKLSFMLNIKILRFISYIKLSFVVKKMKTEFSTPKDLDKLKTELMSKVMAK